MLPRGRLCHVQRTSSGSKLAELAVLGGRVPANLGPCTDAARNRAPRTQHANLAPRTQNPAPRTQHRSVLVHSAQSTPSRVAQSAAVPRRARLSWISTLRHLPSRTVFVGDIAEQVLRVNFRRRCCVVDRLRVLHRRRETRRGRRSGAPFQTAGAAARTGRSRDSAREPDRDTR